LLGHEPCREPQGLAPPCLAGGERVDYRRASRRRSLPSTPLARSGASELVRVPTSLLTGVVGRGRGAPVSRVVLHTRSSRCGAPTHWTAPPPLGWSRSGLIDPDRLPGGRVRQAPLGTAVCFPRWVTLHQGILGGRSGTRKRWQDHTKEMGGLETEGAPNNVGPLHVLCRSSGRQRAAGELSPAGGKESQTPGALIGLNPGFPRCSFTRLP